MVWSMQIVWSASKAIAVILIAFILIAFIQATAIRLAVYVHTKNWIVSA